MPCETTNTPAGNVEHPAGSPWTIQEAATFLRVAVRTLTRAADKRKLRLIRMGRKVLVPDSEVRRLAERGL